MATAENPAEDEQSKVLFALESFFCSPAFTTALGDFMSEHAERLEFVDPAGEQPMVNHATFTQYQHVVESQLCAFLEEQGISHESMVRVCQAAKSNPGGHQSLVCLDYLLASTDYESFMQLAADHVQLHSWGPEDGALDDCELPPAEEDDEGEVVPLDQANEDAQLLGEGQGARGAAVTVAASH